MTDSNATTPTTGESRGLARRLGLFDATMIVMGGIVGSGIFINPSVVARQVHTPFLILCGVFFVAGPHALSAPLLDRPASTDLLASSGAAMTPVMFAYGGWQTASFVAGEMREPRRDLPRGLLIGVCGVILLYTAVNFACLRALGPEGLAETTTPASAVMRLALGPRGAALIAVGIAVSTLGFLSQSMLTAPRVYFAMAEDGVF